MFFRSEIGKKKNINYIIYNIQIQLLTNNALMSQGFSD